MILAGLQGFYRQEWVQAKAPGAELNPVTSSAGDLFADWHSRLSQVTTTMRGLATTSEGKFLRIGEQMQGVSQGSQAISQLTGQLVATASGENLQLLSDRLRRMASGMESFLARFQARNTQSVSTLHYVKELLGQLDSPLEELQKMGRTFYVLEVSIKIESARLGERGEEFLTLARDIKAHSQQVNDKLEAIQGHRDSVLGMISANLGAIEERGSAQEEDARLSLRSTLCNLQELDAAHERFSALGLAISDTVQEVANCIGEVVSALQFNDINRQQLEHIIGALERLESNLAFSQAIGTDETSRQALIVEVGDVCELQEAQLQFASSELYTAVTTVIDNLRAVAGSQATIQQETLSAAGVMDESGGSFIDAVSEGLSTTATRLNACATSRQESSRTLEGMATAIGASTTFAREIDGIAYSIVTTALNAQIKAAKTGQQGAALATLAEEIRRLADEASRHTGEITGRLMEIDTVTTDLINETSNDALSLQAWLTTVEEEIHEVMTMLAGMKGQLYALVTQIQERIAMLAADVEEITAGIDIHERSKAETADALALMAMVIARSRELVPASSEFKESLQEMTVHYTMASERRIHQAIADRHGVELELADQGQTVASTEQSEFGDNVDLF